MHAQQHGQAALAVGRQLLNLGIHVLGQNTHGSTVPHSQTVRQSSSTCAQTPTPEACQRRPACIIISGTVAPYLRRHTLPSMHAQQHGQAALAVRRQLLDLGIHVLGQNTHGSTVPHSQTVRHSSSTCAQTQSPAAWHTVLHSSTAPCSQRAPAIGGCSCSFTFTSSTGHSSACGQTTAAGPWHTRPAVTYGSTAVRSTHSIAVGQHLRFGCKLLELRAHILQSQSAAQQYGQATLQSHRPSPDAWHAPASWHMS